MTIAEHTPEPTVLAETRASVADIAAKVTGTTATLSARRKVRRWIETGVTVRGLVVKLQAVRLGRTYVTSAEAFARFTRACTEPPAHRDRTNTRHTPANKETT